MLYNLDHDPGERYPLTQDNDPHYTEVINNMIARKDMVETDLDWAPPRNNYYGDSAIPCCDPACQPFPSCCSCDNNKYT